MKYILTDEQNFIDIANSIREVSNTTNNLFPNQMSSQIEQFKDDLVSAISSQSSESEQLLEQTNILEQIIGGYTGEFDGGGSTDGNKPIRFYTPYGDLIISYTIEEVRALTTLPVAPVLKGLTFKKWNYTLDQIKRSVGELAIGALYDTSSGKTEIDVTLTKSTGKLLQLRNIVGATSIDWGDGTINPVIENTTRVQQPITVTAPILSETPYSPYNADYSLNLEEGKLYRVTLINPEGTEQTYEVTAHIDEGDISFNSGAVMLGSNLDTENSIMVRGRAMDGSELLESILIFDKVIGEGFPPQFTQSEQAFSTIIYSNVADPDRSSVTITGIEQIIEDPFTHEVADYGNYTILIDGATSLGDSIFNQQAENENYYVTAVRLAQGLVFEDSFKYCRSLTNITIPDGLTTVANQAFYGDSSLQSIIIPDTTESLGIGAFMGCSSLATVSLPSTLAIIPESMLEGATSLRRISLPKDLIEIGPRAFKGCYNILLYDLLNSETIPTLLTADAFEGISDIANLKVRDSLSLDWSQATTWETFKDYIASTQITNYVEPVDQDLTGILGSLVFDTSKSITAITELLSQLNYTEASPDDQSLIATLASISIDGVETPLIQVIYLPPVVIDNVEKLPSSYTIAIVYNNEKYTVWSSFINPQTGNPIGWISFEGYTGFTITDNLQRDLSTLVYPKGWEDIITFVPKEQLEPELFPEAVDLNPIELDDIVDSITTLNYEMPIEEGKTYKLSGIIGDNETQWEATGLAAALSQAELDDIGATEGINYLFGELIAEGYDDGFMQLALYTNSEMNYEQNRPAPHPGITTIFIIIPNKDENGTPINLTPQQYSNIKLQMVEEITEGI